MESLFLKLGMEHYKKYSEEAESSPVPAELTSAINRLLEEGLPFEDQCKILLGEPYKPGLSSFEIAYALAIAQIKLQNLMEQKVKEASQRAKDRLREAFADTNLDPETVETAINLADQATDSKARETLTSRLQSAEAIGIAARLEQIAPPGIAQLARDNINRIFGDEAHRARVIELGKITYDIEVEFNTDSNS